MEVYEFTFKDIWLDYASFPAITFDKTFVPVNWELERFILEYWLYLSERLHV